jgi:hypothetical protein
MSEFEEVRTPKVSLILYYFLIIFLFFLEGLNSLFSFESRASSILVKLDEVIVLLYFIIAIVLTLMKGTMFFQKNVFVLLFIFLALGSAPYMSNSEIDFVRLAVSIFLIVKPLLLFFVFSNLPANEYMLKKISNFYIVVYVILVTFGYIQMTGIDTPWHLDYRPYFDFYTPTSIFGHHTLWATALSFGVILSIFRVVEGRASAISLFIICYFVIMLFLTTSRRHILFIPIAVFITMYLSSPARTKLSLLKNGIILLIVVSPILYVILDIIWVTIEREYIEKWDTRDRVLLYYGALKIMYSHSIFGVGFGYYGSWPTVLFGSDWYSIVGIDNIVKPHLMLGAPYSSVLAESGLLGILFYVSMFAVIIKRLLLIKKVIGKSVVSLTLICFLILGLVESLVHPFFTGSIASYILFATLGVIYSVYRGKTNEIKK